MFIMKLNLKQFNAAPNEEPSVCSSVVARNRWEKPIIRDVVCERRLAMPIRKQKRVPYELHDSYAR